ncbi:MAG: hypothetical protein RLZZ142_2767 [Verrucomicrobiota bacterium]|jgi:RNA polymerase sigma factor (sigma-70 family)
MLPEDSMRDTPPRSHTDFLRDTLARYERPLLRYAQGFVPELHQARDVVQEVFIKLAQNVASLDRENIAPWLFTVCKNRALDHCRKHQHVVPMDHQAFDHHPASNPAPSTLLEHRETAQLVQLWIQHLPEKQREAIRLKFESGLSYQQIAETLHTSIGNVGTLIHLGIQSLKQSWAAQNA